jgi:transcription elongation factor
VQSSYVCATAWDHIEVFEGEKPGVYGVADEIAQDVVTITDVGVESLPVWSVHKRSKPVKIMTAKTLTR